MTKALDEIQYKNICQIVGCQFVEIRSEILETRMQTTFHTSQKVGAIVYPKSAQEIQMLFELGYRQDLSFYPVSRGKNYGCGAKVPPTNTSILLSLDRMNNITDFDEDLAYIQFEPGVTQKQVVEFLEAKHSNLVLGLTGSVSDSSLMGNILERGDAEGVHGERSQYVCGFEVMLPSGEKIETGMNRFANSKAGSVFQGGLGPDLEGLFLQSNLGVVTKLTLWLEQKPKHVHLFYIAAETTVLMGEVADMVLPLGLRNWFQCFTVWNDIKSFMTLEQLQLNKKEKQVFNNQVRQDFRKRYNLEHWTVLLTCYSYSYEEAAARVKNISEVLRRCDLKFEVEEEISDGNALANKRRNVDWVYWRKTKAAPSDPDIEMDKCGLIWCMLVVPFSGRELSEIGAMVESICFDQGFEPNISFTSRQKRSVRLLLAIVYDREIKGEDEKAMNCHDEIMRCAAKKGVYPYRLGIQSMNCMKSGSNPYLRFLRGIKKHLDPKGVLAPGRYIF